MGSVCNAFVRRSTRRTYWPTWPCFWAAAPKGRCPVGHRGEFPDVRPSVRLSFRPSPPGWPSRPHILTLRPDLGPLSPQISPPGLKSALQASNQLSRHQISSPGLKSALQTSNQHSRPQISIPGPKSALQASNLPKACPQTSNLNFRHKSSPRPQTRLNYLLSLLYSPSGPM